VCWHVVERAWLPQFGGDVTVQAKAAACEQIRHGRFVASALCQTAASFACTKIIRKRPVSKRWRMAAVAGGRQRTTIWPLPAAMLVFHVCDQDFRKREIRLITQRSQVQILPPLPSLTWAFAQVSSLSGASWPKESRGSRPAA
jgi:hypothetical protein